MLRAKLSPLAAVPAPARARPSLAGWRALVEDLMRVADLVAVAAAGLLAVGWRFEAQAPEPVLAALAIGCLLAANTLPWMRLYRADRLTRLGFQLPRALAGWTLAVAGLLAILFAFKAAHELSRLWVGAWLVMGGLGLVANRLLLRVALARGDAARSLVRRLAVAGAGDQLAELLRRLAATAAGVEVAAVLDLDGALAGRWPAGAVRLSGLPELTERAYRGEVDDIVLALPPGHGLEDALRRLRHLPVDVSWAPALPGRAVPILGAADAGDVPLVRLTKRPLDGWQYVLKAAEDRALAALLLLLLSPLLAAVAVAVRLDSPGKVFYRQLRHGFSREPILVLKFRTMHQAACDPRDAAIVVQAVRGDPRVTRLGRFLRRTSLDELPQLWNVLRGEMSLVGPRPHALAHDQYYADLIDDYLGRQRVKPGITGWAQVHGHRGETRSVEDMRKRIELDIEYIDRWSILLDLRILWLTVWRGFRHRNAY